MEWLLVEALAAAGLLVFMIWWTMFSGRRHGEPGADIPASQADADPAPTPPRPSAR